MEKKRRVVKFVEPQQPIESPYAPKRSKRGPISDAEVAVIKKMLGVEKIFIVADTENHECKPETCTGHSYLIENSGFSETQMAGIIMSFAEEIMKDMERND